MGTIPCAFKHVIAIYQTTKKQENLKMSDSDVTNMLGGVIREVKSIALEQHQTNQNLKDLVHVLKEISAHLKALALKK